MRVNATPLLDGSYVIAATGCTIRREHLTQTPNGECLGGQWAYRDARGGVVGF